MAGLSEYARIESKLRDLGFKRPAEGVDQAIICRWDYRGILVDVMPTDEKILGFTNRWYSDAIREKIAVKLTDGTSIFIFSVPYFLATKLEALKDRGENDLRLSQDLEDIVSVLDGCMEIEAQLSTAPPDLKAYFREEFTRLFGDRSYLNEAISGFLRGAGNSSTRSEKVTEIMERLLEN